MKSLITRLVYLAFAIPALVFAQSSVSGKITDQGAGLPLPGVNISIKGTNKGTVSDFDGKFTVESINKGQELVFEYLGFKTKTIQYTGQETIDVKLIEDIAKLSEVVLIGYGTAAKGDVTGAVDTVSKEDFNKGAIVSPEQLLSAKTPGVRVTSAGGAPGAGSRIRIRGGSSLTGNSDPLIVIDGIPLDQRGVQGVRNQLNAINPNDIEDFVVLKDAASTAIYGSRASNGVILITTKKGKKNTPWSFEIDSKASISSLNRTVDVLSADDFRSLVNAEGSEDQKALLGTENTNWQNQIFDDAMGTITNLSIAKGFEKTALRGGFSYTDQDGILKTDNYERVGFTLNAIQDIGTNLKLTLTSKQSKDQNRFANNDAINNALVFDPTQPVSTANGEFFESRADDGQIDVNAPANPLGALVQDDNWARNVRNITNLAVDYKIPFVTGLKYNMNLGIDYSEVIGRQNRAADIGINKLKDVPFFKEYSGINRNQLLDFNFNYKKDIDAIDTNVDLTAGYSYQEFLESRKREETKNKEQISFYNVDRNLLVSYFGRANFDIANKYLVSASIRRDGSSRFSKNNRFGIFPGVSLGWKLHNEKFLENFAALNQFKIRGGWGVTGQQELRDQNLGFLPIITSGNSQARAQFGNEFVTTFRPQPFNSDLKWEETVNRNIGFDYGFFDNRISGSFDYYIKDTKDLLADVPLPAGSNLVDRFVVNAAETQASGVEFAINADLVRKKDFNWGVNFNATYNEVEIKKLSLSDDPDFSVPQGGISGGVGNNIQFWKPGFNPTTFNVYRQVYDVNGKPIEGAYVDVNGDNEITEEDRVPTKKANPDVFLGFSSNMNYKNFDFSFTFRGSFGGYNYNNVKSLIGNENAVLNTPGNYLGNAHSDINNTGFTSQELFSDYYLESADFVRLDNISLGYNFSFEKFKLRLSLTGTNLWTITNYDGIDPEIFVTDPISQREGIDDKSYPRPRTFVLGANIKF